MINVVGDADVLTNELLAHALVQAGALVFQGGGGEIVKKEADEIENGGGFEDYSVTARSQLAGVDGEMGFFAGANGEFLRVEGANVRGVGFCPAGGGAFLDGDGKLGMSFAIGREQAQRIPQSRLPLAARKDPSSNLTFLDRQITGTPDYVGSVFSGERGSRFDKPPHTAIALLPGHWQEAGVLRLAAGQRERSFDRGAQRVLIDAVGGGARGAAVNNGTNRNRQPMLSDVLMNAIVGETRQGIGNFVDVDFRLLGSRGFGETKNRLDNAAKLAFVEKLRGFWPDAR